MFKKMMSFIFVFMMMSSFSSCGLVFLLIPQGEETPVKLYEPGMSNPQLEKKLTELVVTNDKKLDKQDSRDDYKYNDTIAKVYIISKDWYILRNKYGIVVGRGVQAQVIGKTNVMLKSGNFSNTSIHGDFKAGEYYSQIWSFEQNYIGGEFSDTISNIEISSSGSHRGRHHINQEEAKKAVKGDFSFLD